MATSRLLAVLRWSWRSPSQPPAFRNSLRWTLGTDFSLSTDSLSHRSHWWCSGWRVKVMWSQQLVEPQTRFSREAGCLDCWQSAPAVEGGAFLLSRSRRTEEDAWVCVWMPCGCQADYSQLGYWFLFLFFKKERKIFLDWQIVLHLCSWGPTRANRCLKVSNLSKEDDHPPPHPMRQPFNKEVRSSEQKHPIFSILLVHMSRNTNCQQTALKKQHTMKSKEGQQNMLNFSQKSEESQRKMPGTDCQETDMVLTKSFNFWVQE